MNARSRFFQIHLSTALVLMFTGWVLVGGIIRNYRTPVRVRISMTGVVQTADSGRTRLMMIEALIAIIILLIVWQFCEWLIRRRAARKANE